MNLLLDTQRAQLLANGKANNLPRNHGLDEIDFPPVVKLFTPDGGATWLFTEVNPDEPDIAFGFCYLGMGCPEFGYVSLAEITALHGKLGLSVERDLHFVTDRLLSDYAAEASQKEGARGPCRWSGPAGQTATVAQVVAEAALQKGAQHGVGKPHNLTPAIRVWVPQLLRADRPGSQRHASLAGGRLRHPRPQPRTQPP